MSVVSYTTQTSSSTTKLDMDDPDAHVNMKAGILRQRRMMFIGAVLAVLLVIFAALYFSTLGGGKAEEAGGGNSGASTGDKVTTTPAVIPTEVITTTTEASITKAPELSKCNQYKVRLPKDVTPLHYDISLNTNLKTFDIIGTADIKIRISNKRQQYVLLHARGYKSIKASLKDSSGNEVTLEDQFYCKCDAPKNATADPTFKMCNNTIELYVLKPVKSLATGDYTITFDFAYILTNNLKGYYKSNYKDKNGNEKFVATTQMEPVDARAAFPCFDEPALKATFTLTLAHDPALIAISNMPVANNVVKSGLRYDTFQISPKMPTYLVAFVICDFGYLETVTVPNSAVNGSRAVEMKFYAPKDQLDQIEYAVETGKKIISFFERYFNVSYPLPKADMIAIPDFSAGAMENWGLVTYRMSALLWDKKHSSQSNKYRVASIISHELAHQWFGNIVTMEWWSDLWLNEGFASYVEYLGVDDVHPEWQALDDMIITDQRKAFKLDALVSSHPVYVEVSSPSQIGEIFDSISYNKGCSILRMLNDVLSAETFVKGLNLYLNKYSYGNAKTVDLWNALAEASKKTSKPFDATAFMNTWTLQMGFPVVHVEKLDNGSYLLTQERFLIDPKPDMSKSKYTSEYGYKWIIPFNYITVDKNGVASKPTKVWMDSGSAIIDGVASESIVKGNAGHYGFFRVNYADSHWQSITNLLKADINAFNRKDKAGMLGDAFDLAKSGRLNYTVALDLFSYIANETDSLPWLAGRNAIGYVSGVLTDTRPALKAYKKFMLKMTDKMYKKIGFSKAKLNHSDTYLRNIILSTACSCGNIECRQKVSEMFTEWMANPTNNTIPPDLRSLVYFYGILNGGQAEWDFMWDQFTSTNVASEKYKLLNGLSAAQEPWMIDRYLSYSLDPTKVKGQDASYVFNYVANSNPQGRFFAWNYLTKNWHIITKRFGDSFFTMRRIFDSVATGFTTNYELEMVKKFASTIEDPGTAERIIIQSQEKIKSNIEWLEGNEKMVETWLLKNHA